MNTRITRTLGAIAIVTTSLITTIAVTSPAEAAPARASVSSVAAAKNLRHYTLMRDIYKTLNIVTSYTTSGSAGIGTLKNVKTVHTGSIYKGSVTVKGTPTVFTITGSDSTDHIVKRLRSDHGTLTYLN